MERACGLRPWNALLGKIRQASRAGRWIDVQVNLWDGALIQRLSEMRGVAVIRIADVLARADRLSPIDHFHPGTLGYAAIARRIADTF